MFRSKTSNKRSTTKKNSNVTGPITPVKNDLSGADISGVAIEKPILNERANTVVTTENFFSALLDAESKAAVHRPWLRLERGVRIRLLRTYVENRANLTQADKDDLLHVLKEGLDKKMLNSKSQITYNMETGTIVEINALKVIQPTNSKTVFKIEPPNRSTKKVKRSTTGSDSE